MITMAFAWAFSNAANGVQWWGPLLTAIIIMILLCLAIGEEE